MFVVWCNSGRLCNSIQNESTTAVGLTYRSLHTTRAQPSTGGREANPANVRRVTFRDVSYLCQGTRRIVRNLCLHFAKWRNLKGSQNGEQERGEWAGGRRERSGRGCWLLNVPTTCKAHPRPGRICPDNCACCHSETKKKKKKKSRSNFLSYQVTIYWHQANQSQHWTCNARCLTGQALENQLLSHWYDWAWPRLSYREQFEEGDEETDRGNDAKTTSTSELALSGIYSRKPRTARSGGSWL